MKRALSSKTKAVFLAHTLGNPFDLDAVTDFCRQNGLWLIEDNCDALGAEWNGKKTGAFGDFGTSSFYPPHHMTTGEGGAVYTNNPLLKKIALSLRDWGRDCCCPPGTDNFCGVRFAKRYGSLPEGYDHKYVYSHFGFNLKATDLQAAIGCTQLEKLPSFVAKRRENHAFLFEKLKGFKEFSIQRALPAAKPSWFGFLVTLTGKAAFSRNEMTAFLENKGIQTRALFAGNLLRHPCFETLTENVDYRVVSDLKNTDMFMNRAFWVGVYPGMSAAEMNFTADAMADFARMKG